MSRHERKQLSIFSSELIGPAIADSFRKLDPRQLIRNPVMFTTGVVAVLLTVSDGRACRGRLRIGFQLQLVFWLWLTVLFGNFAEALAEGRGKAQAASLRDTKAQLTAKRDQGRARLKSSPPQQLRAGDIVLVETGDLIPPTARWSRASPRSTRRRSPASPRRSSARPAATARP